MSWVAPGVLKSPNFLYCFFIFQFNVKYAVCKSAAKEWLFFNKIRFSRSLSSYRVLLTAHEKGRSIFSSYEAKNLPWISALTKRVLNFSCYETRWKIHSVFTGCSEVNNCEPLCYTVFPIWGKVLLFTFLTRNIFTEPWPPPVR